MKLSIWSLVILLALSECGFAQSVRVRDSTVIDQQDCPLKFKQWKGSAVVVKNVSRQQIVRFELICVERIGKSYKLIEQFDPSEGLVAPGAFSSEWGFDATPLNACRSRKGLLTVASVRFADGNEWSSHLVEKGNGASPR